MDADQHRVGQVVDGVVRGGQNAGLVTVILDRTQVGDQVHARNAQTVQIFDECPSSYNLAGQIL